MTRVLHVVDGSCNETILQVVEALRARAEPTDLHRFCLIDAESQTRVRDFLGAEVNLSPARWIPTIQPGSPLRKFADVDVVHAWGVSAASTAVAQLRAIPLVITLLDPTSTSDAAKWVRSFPQGAAIVAGSQIIRTRLVTAGIAPERIVVIRGPVDFAAINKSREQNLRQQLLGDAKPVLLMTGPASRSGGEYTGLWAAAVVAQVHRGLRVLVPYASPERDRLLRFITQIGMRHMVVIPDNSLTWSQLVGCADAMIAPAIDEICTEPLAAAMAAGTVIVGSAVRSITELIADKHNGLLCKPGEARLLAARILTALEDDGLRRQVVQVARGQAYEVFSARAFAENYAKLYQNLQAGQALAQGVQDTAMVA